MVVEPIRRVVPHRLIEAGTTAPAQALGGPHDAKHPSTHPTLRHRRPRHSVGLTMRSILDPPYFAASPHQGLATPITPTASRPPALPVGCVFRSSTFS